ncbi:MAG: lysophospholipid acyltransferase family protein [Acidobacteriota bacterium]|nr:lysophospholipid acyltransferase family protein [Acidobacteriota bacterium]
MRFWMEFVPVWLAAEVLRWLPRPLARAVGRSIGLAFYHLYPRLRRVGQRNLAMAFPEKTPAGRERILRGVYLSLGRLLAEVPKFPEYTLQNVERIAVYDGLENYLAARDRGKGVLFMTAHVGGWEIGSFVHSLHGHWLNIVVRDLDNPILNRWVKRLREMHGNKTHDKNHFARGLMAAMKRGETVGALMDTNMTPPQGVFVDYFGVPACTAVGIARVAMHTGAAVLPAFTVWDEQLGKYRIRFEPAIPTIDTGNPEADAVANTQNYTAAIERIVRAYPEQWLWLHRRWKTRPAGEPSLY